MKQQQIDEIAKATAILFAEWLPRNAMPKSINRNWVLNADRKEYTTNQLYDKWYAEYYHKP